MTEPKKVLTRDEIFAADDQKVEAVYVAEWGGEVLVRSLTGSERDNYEQSIIEQRKGGDVRYRFDNARAKLCVLSVVDETGKRLFSHDDIPKFGSKNSNAVQKVFNKARELSGLSEEDIEELVGNSETDQSESSTSA